MDVRIVAEEATEAGEDTEVARIANSLAGFREKGRIRVIWVYGPDESEGVVPPSPNPR